MRLYLFTTVQSAGKSQLRLRSEKLSSNDFLQRQTITQRLLPFVYHEGIFMFPPDPYGRKGPSLDQLLSFWENEQKTENCMHKNRTIICKYENSTCDVILSKLEYYILSLQKKYNLWIIKTYQTYFETCLHCKQLFVYNWEMTISVNGLE